MSMWRLIELSSSRDINLWSYKKHWAIGLDSNLQSFHRLNSHLGSKIVAKHQASCWRWQTMQTVNYGFGCTQILWFNEYLVSPCKMEKLLQEGLKMRTFSIPPSTSLTSCSQGVKTLHRKKGRKLNAGLPWVRLGHQSLGYRIKRSITLSVGYVFEKKSNPFIHYFLKAIV